MRGVHFIQSSAEIINNAAERLFLVQSATILNKVPGIKKRDSGIVVPARKLSQNPRKPVPPLQIMVEGRRGGSGYLFKYFS